MINISVILTNHADNYPPYPPMPVKCGNVTPKQNCTATAASTAVPPSCKISKPIAVHCLSLVINAIFGKTP